MRCASVRTGVERMFSETARTSIVTGPKEFACGEV